MFYERFQSPEVHVILSLALASWFEPALAAGFEAKTMRAPLSSAEVERPLVIGRGWMEFGLGADLKDATGAWSADGDVVPFDSARWRYATGRIGVRYGISRAGELWASVPYHYVRLSNDALGTDTADNGLGDPSFGWKFEWLRANDASQVPTSSLVTELSFRVPAGKEAPGSFIGGPNTVESFVMSTGTTDIDLTVRGRKRFGAVAVTGSVGYDRRTSGVSQFVVETKNRQFGGRFKPGDEFHASVEPMVQLGPVAVGAEAALRHRQDAAVGTTSGGMLMNRNLDTIEGSGGLMLDVKPGLVVNATRTLDVRAQVGIPVMGDGLAFFPLETITPTYGLTYSGTLAFRY